MSRRRERSETTAREMFLEQAAAYFDDLKITTESVPIQTVRRHVLFFRHSRAGGSLEK